MPKDTLAIWSTFVFQEQFDQHDQFIPERWLNSNQEICPYSARLFSHGPRMCIGKRFAELELIIAVHQIMLNFQLEWVNQEPLLTLSQVLVNVPDQTLDFKFNDLK